MKIFHLLFMGLILTFIGCVHAMENEMESAEKSLNRCVDATIGKAKKGIAQCLNVTPSAFGSAGSPSIGGYTSFYLGFEHKQNCFTEAEGRRLVVCAANMLLQTINSEEKIQSVLTPSPFEIQNIQLTIFNPIPSKDKLGTIPYLEGVSLLDGNIKYLYIIRRGEGYHSIVRETYDEALAILEKEKTNCTSTN